MFARFLISYSNVICCLKLTLLVLFSYLSSSVDSSVKSCSMALSLVICSLIIFIYESRTNPYPLIFNELFDNSYISRSKSFFIFAYFVFRRLICWCELLSSSYRLPMPDFAESSSTFSFRIFSSSVMKCIYCYRFTMYSS